MKGFFISDTHGTHPDNVKKSLELKGYDINNDNHAIGIAGDITDGLGHDGILIDYFIDLQQQGKLKCAIKGNHDVLNNAQDRVVINKAQKKGLQSLPYQVETEDFYMAHGMYVLDNMVKGSQNIREVSLGGCPVLLGHTFPNGNIKHYAYNSLAGNIKSLDEYVGNFRNKPLILGHFGNGKVAEGLDKSHLAYSYHTDEDGFITYRNITGVDSDVIHSTPKGLVKVKVIDFA